MTQATVDHSTTEDHEEVGRHRARLVAEAIASFDTHGQEPTTFHDSPTSTGVVYLSNVAVGPARECRGIRFGIVCMMNDFGILVVSRAGGNTIWIAP